MATLPGAPHSHPHPHTHEADDTEANTLPVEPEFAPVVPDEPNDGDRTPVRKPGE